MDRKQAAGDSQHQAVGLGAVPLRMQGRAGPQPLPTWPPCCRQRLSSEAFSSFLQAIKELNSGKLNRNDTLQRARDIFGSTNRELYGVHAFSVVAMSACALLLLLRLCAGLALYAAACASLPELPHSCDCLPSLQVLLRRY